MKTILNYQLLNKLLSEGNSYKEIVQKTGYNSNSVYGYFYKKFGKLNDRNKSRRQIIKISNFQNEVLFGTLLGDGNIQKFGKSFIGRTNHSISQKDYCLYKQSLLNNLTYNVKYVDKTVNNKIYKQCYFCLKPNESLKDLYNMFYSKNKKDIPLDLSLLTPLAMAIWFMDDGTASSKCSISIATCSFSLESLLRLQKYLLDTYNIKITIQKDFKIYFEVKSAKIFYELVKPYIIDSMMYKFKFLNSLSADLKSDELLESLEN